MPRSFSSLTGSAVKPLLALTALALVGTFLPAACALNTEGSDYHPSGSSSAGAGGAGSASGSSSSGATVVGSGAGGVTPENCYDGEDNDGDGAVDCADTADCEPLVECITSAPEDWTEYARFTRQAFPASGSTPKCPNGADALVYFAGPAAEDPKCSACSCEWSGGACSPPGISCWKDTKSCDGSSSFTKFATNTDCFPVSNFIDKEDASCRLTVPAIVLNPGTCAAKGGDLNPAWAEVVYVCPAPSSPGSGGCESGKACVPKGSGAFGGSACATRKESKGCPGGWKAQEVKAFGGADDTRACAPCKCASGVSCEGGSYEVRAYNDCTGSSSTVDSANCKNVTNQLDDNAGSMKLTPPELVKGKCGGGEPSGKLKTKDPLTICCP